MVNARHPRVKQCLESQVVKCCAWSSEYGEGKQRRQLGIAISPAQGGWSQAALERISSMPCRCDAACTGSQQHRPKGCINIRIIKS